MKEETVRKVFETIEKNKGINFIGICAKIPKNEHSVRKALKVLISRGLVTYYVLGHCHKFYTMNKILMYYTKQERDQAYLNYLKQFEFGVTQKQMARDLGMDVRTFKRDIMRVVSAGKVSKTKESNMIVYKRNDKNGK